ncbi:unnamed protein product [Ranitomeya imitator]|uniref:Uncharacterized protein n=1 Tax=Ranitomeya imitator TaxID=111125 RepID=A0ABN9LVL6_9NEOB|nr:unnamed protein product [Ranitomeya imitator]
MDKDWTDVTKRLLSVAFEIISLLTGEDYTIAKKTSGDCVTPGSHESEGRSMRRSPITDPPPHSPIHERSNKKILELANKIIELLTGEGEDTIDIKAEIIDEEAMEADQPDKRNPSERCSRPLHSQDRSEENHNVPENHQVEDLTIIKVEIKAEEEGIWGDPLSEEEEEFTPDFTTENPEEDFTLPLNYKVEDENIAHHASGDFNAHPRPHNTDLSYNPPSNETSTCDQSKLITSTDQEGGVSFQFGEQFLKSSDLGTHRGIHINQVKLNMREVTLKRSQFDVHTRRGKINYVVQKYNSSRKNNLIISVEHSDTASIGYRPIFAVSEFRYRVPIFL